MHPTEFVQPDFIIGGAPRSGTTSLAQALNAHPEIEIAQPFIPEPKVFMTESTRGAEGYLRRYQTLFTKREGIRFRGEKTSGYLENEDALQRIGQTFQHMRFVFVAREPISRAYSNYLWSRQNGFETLSFEEAIEQEARRESPLPPEQGHVRPFDYLVRGDYGTYAERYYSAFGRENVAFFLFEDLRDNPQDLLGAIQRFVGVKPVDLTPHGQFIGNETDSDNTPLDPELELKLREMARPLALKFAQVTGVGIGPWGY